MKSVWSKCKALVAKVWPTALSWLTGAVKKWVFWVIAALAVIVLILFADAKIQRHRVQQLKTSNTELSADRTALLASVRMYDTKLGESAASVDRLTLRCNELELYRKQASEQIKALNIRLKDAQDYAQTVTETTVEVTTPIYVTDTVYVNSDNERMFQWSDAWVDVSGKVTDNNISCTVHSVDTLVHVAHKVPRKFLFFKYGSKGVRMDVVSKNPHTQIVYAEYIKID